jgi:hypothetical protein
MRRVWFDSAGHRHVANSPTCYALFETISAETVRSLAQIAFLDVHCRDWKHTFSRLSTC